jgi:hypothetical protein
MKHFSSSVQGKDELGRKSVAGKSAPLSLQNKLEFRGKIFITSRNFRQKILR